jgi:hypothetical protein
MFLTDVDYEEYRGGDDEWNQVVISYVRLDRQSVVTPGFCVA